MTASATDMVVEGLVNELLDLVRELPKDLRTHGQNARLTCLTNGLATLHDFVALRRDRS